MRSKDVILFCPQGSRTTLGRWMCMLHMHMRTCWRHHDRWAKVGRSLLEPGQSGPTPGKDLAEVCRLRVTGGRFRASVSRISGQKLGPKVRGRGGRCWSHLFHRRPMRCSSVARPAKRTEKPAATSCSPRAMARASVHRTRARRRATAPRWPRAPWPNRGSSPPPARNTEAAPRWGGQRPEGTQGWRPSATAVGADRSHGRRPGRPGRSTSAGEDWTRAAVGRAAWLEWPSRRAPRAPPCPTPGRRPWANLRPQRAQPPTPRRGSLAEASTLTRHTANSRSIKRLASGAQSAHAPLVNHSGSPRAVSTKGQES